MGKKEWQLKYFSSNKTLKADNQQWGKFGSYSSHFINQGSEWLFSQDITVLLREQVGIQHSI